MLIKKIQNKFSNFLYIIKLHWKKVGAKNIICQGHNNIIIEKSCYIGRNSWLAAVPLTGAEDCKLIIQSGTYIGNFAHIYATESITIEKNVLIADRVYIADNSHGYNNIEKPIIKQPIIQKRNVIIGEGSWLGENVCIVGVTVGKHCIIGANSVVTKDIPDYCVAVGSPAKIIKKYDFESKKWIKNTINKEK